MRNYNDTIMLKHQNGEMSTALMYSEFPNLHFYVATWLRNPEWNPTMEGLPYNYSRTCQLTYGQALESYKNITEK